MAGEEADKSAEKEKTEEGESAVDARPASSSRDVRSRSSGHRGPPRDVHDRHHEWNRNRRQGGYEGGSEGRGRYRGGRGGYRGGGDHRGEYRGGGGDGRRDYRGGDHYGGRRGGRMEGRLDHRDPLVAEKMRVGRYDE